MIKISFSFTFKKLDLFDKFDYEKIRKYIEENIPRKLEIYKEFRALLVREGEDDRVTFL